MKKRILTAFLLAGALVVTPLTGGFFSAVATASSNVSDGSFSTSIENLIQNAGVDAAVKRVWSYDTATIGSAMVSGNAEILDTMAALEKSYMEAKGISETTVEVSGVEGVDASQVKVTGAGLNVPNGGGAALSIGVSDQSVKLPEGCANAKVLEISMAGLHDLAKLPMMITMPVPSGVNADKVVVLHYARGTENAPVALQTAKNGDGTISFYVTGFSVFAFAESDGTVSGDTSSGNTSSGNTSSESGEEGDSSDVQSDLADQIANAESGAVIRVSGINTLSNSVMHTLLVKGDVTLVMEYTYEGVDYVITIPAAAAENKDIPWYGPLYLAGRYGHGAVPVKGANGPSYTVQSGDTMSRIAQANGMTLSQLAAKNPQVKNIDYIVVGQKINLN